MDGSVFISANFWTAVSTVGLFWVTVGLLFFAWRQIKAVREENAKWKTLTICERYDTDPVLHASLEVTYKYKKGTLILDNASELKPQVATILNYLDGIAIGVKQGLYDREIVKDHLHAVINGHIKTYLKSNEEAEKYGIDRQNYAHLMSLHEEFNRPEVSYQNTWMPNRPRK